MLGDGSPEDLAFNSVEKTLQPPIVLKNPLLEENRTLKEDSKAFLEQQIGERLQRIIRFGGNGKNAFLAADNSKVVLITNTMDKSDNQYKNFQQQIKFYERLSGNEDFKRAVVPMERKIEDQEGYEVGMVQPFFGVGLDEFLKGGGGISQFEIDKFVASYKKVIEATGVAHGNLANGKTDGFWNVSWDNIRIDLKTGQLKFIDYNGANGGIIYDGRIYRDANTELDDHGKEEYRKVLHEEPERLREILYQAFGQRRGSLLSQRAA